MSSKFTDNDNLEKTSETPSEMALAASVDASFLDPTVSSALSDLIAEYRRLEGEIATLRETHITPLEEDLASLKDTITSICLTIPSKRILGKSEDGKPWGTTRTAKTTSTLNQNKLIEESTKRGYDPIEVKTIIDLSTEKTKGKEYVLINIGK